MAVATAVAGFAFNAVGTGLNAKAESDAHKHNADLRRKEAELKRQDASENAARTERNHNRELGRLRASFAGSGLQETGSPLDIFGEQAGEFELQIADIYNGAEREAIQLENQARLDDFSASQSKTKAGFDILGSGVETASSIFKNDLK